MYVFQLFDYYGGSKIVLLVSFIECAAVSYVYGKSIIGPAIIKIEFQSLKLVTLSKLNFPQNLRCQARCFDLLP